MVLYPLCVFQCIFPTGGTFFSPSVNLPLYVRHPYMKGCLVTFCINTGRPLHYSFKMLFQLFYILCVYFSASTFKRAGYFLVLLYIRPYMQGCLVTFFITSTWKSLAIRAI